MANITQINVNGTTYDIKDASAGNVATYNATDVASTSDAPVLFVLKDSYHCNGWQNMFFARSEDEYFYVQFPAETMDTSKTYTCASFTGAYKNFINDTSTTVTTGASTEVRFQGGICMAIFPIPTGVGTWTYGAIFPTSHVDITANN